MTETVIKLPISIDGVVEDAELVQFRSELKEEIAKDVALADGQLINRIEAAKTLLTDQAAAVSQATDKRLKDQDHAIAETDAKAAAAVKSLKNDFDSLSENIKIMGNVPIAVAYVEKLDPISRSYRTTLNPYFSESYQSRPDMIAGQGLVAPIDGYYEVQASLNLALNKVAEDFVLKSDGPGNRTYGAAPFVKTDATFSTYSASLSFIRRMKKGEHVLVDIAGSADYVGLASDSHKSTVSMRWVAGLK
ncbi:MULTISPECIES: hypothetical protein [Streptomyces]